jgi:hypothetical protein
MSRTSRRFLAGLVAILAIAGFGFLYCYGIVLCWIAPTETTRSFKPEYVYVATALAGLVGGVVAMIFNEKLPDAPPQAARQAGATGATPSASGFRAGLTAIKNTFTGGKIDVLAFISTVYVIAYFLVSCLAIATWIKLSDHTPDLIKNLALIGIGLFVAIARSFFNVPPPKQREVA